MRQLLSCLVSFFVAVANAKAFAVGELSSSDLGFDYRASQKVIFCEAKYGGLFRGFVSNRSASYFPEYGAAVSAPAISVFGLHMLLFWQHDSNLLLMISALFVINGIGSFLFHYSGLTRWGDLDGETMIMAVWMVFGFIISEITEAMQSKGLIHRRFRKVLMACVWILSMGLVYWLTTTHAFLLLLSPAKSNSSTSTLKGVEVSNDIGALAIAVPIGICLAVVYVAICMGWVIPTDVEIAGFQTEKSFRCRLHLGVFFTAVGICTWVVTEKFCDDFEIVRWVPGHLIWHVTCAYGLTNCLIYAATLRADNVGVPPQLRTIQRPATCWGWVKNIYFVLFPAFAFVACAKVLPEEAIEEAEEQRRLQWPALTALQSIKTVEGLRSKIDPEQGAARSALEKPVPYAPRLGGRGAPTAPQPAESLSAMDAFQAVRPKTEE